MPTESLIAQSEASFAAWPQNWRVQALIAPPLIAPARQYIYPQLIAGEEDALARGALQLMVTPSAGGTFLATFTLGFTSNSMPTGIFACPDPNQLCAVAGGYVYIVDTLHPERCTHLPLKPAVEIRVLAEQRLLLFVGFHHLLAWGEQGLAWETARLSWEGLRLGEISSEYLRGFGWNLQTDREAEFIVNLTTGGHTGGGF